MVAHLYQDPCGDCLYSAVGTILQMHGVTAVHQILGDRLCFRYNGWRANPLFDLGGTVFEVVADYGVETERIEVESLEGLAGRLPVIAVVDSYFLPHYPTAGAQHNWHNIIVTELRPGAAAVLDAVPAPFQGELPSETLWEAMRLMDPPTAFRLTVPAPGQVRASIAGRLPATIASLRHSRQEIQAYCADLLANGIPPERREEFRIHMRFASDQRRRFADALREFGASAQRPFAESLALLAQIQEAWNVGRSLLLKSVLTARRSELERGVARLVEAAEWEHSLMDALEADSRLYQRTGAVS